MSLRRLLFAGVSALFALLLAAVEAIHVSSARHYLEQQLEAHAGETATSLALTLGALMAEPDAGLVGTVVNPVFDRGHFAAISITGPAGQTLASRTLDPGELPAPAWFRALFPIEAPSGSALIAAGWRQLGRVEVRVHPYFAYAQLWDTALRTALVLAALYAAALAGAGLVLGAILRPLARVEQAALDIANRDFRAIAPVARPRELSRVVAAMNRLSGKLRDAMAQEAERFERGLREAYEDPVTGALNERGFAQRARAALEGEDALGAGALALIVPDALEDVNLSGGREEGDARLRALAALLARGFEGSAPLVGRHRGAALLVLLPQLTRAQLERWAAQLQGGARGAGMPATAGLVHFEGVRPRPAELVLWAEVALERARQSGRPSEVLDFAAASGEARSLADWGAALAAALGAGRLALAAQPVFALPSRGLLHREVMLRLLDEDGAPVSAARFLPAAARLGLLPRLDAEVLERLARSRADGRFALNVSAQAIASAEYRATLRRVLPAHPGLGPRLTFEATPYAVALDPAATEAFARAAKALGAQVALDDMELSVAALGWARRLMPAYVKLAPVYAAEMHRDAAARFVVESTVAVLAPLESRVIVKGVETEALLEALERSPVGGYQGYAAAPPEPLA